MSNNSLESLVIGHVNEINYEQAVKLYEVINESLKTNSTLKSLIVTVNHNVPQELLDLIEYKLAKNSHQDLAYTNNLSKRTLGFFSSQQELSSEQQQILQYIRKLMPDVNWVYNNGQLSLGSRDRDVADNFVRTLNLIFTKCNVPVFAEADHINRKITLNDISLDILKVLVEKHSGHFFSISEFEFSLQQSPPRP